MVVLAASVCTKGGKILVSRQFSNITKFALEEYIKSFPKLIQASQQHTFVESDTARYLYLPLEGMYLVLITNKNSNIIEDLETIRFLQKVIIDVCSHGVSEANISKNAIDVLLAFDDVIAFGYRESVTSNQISTYLAMESSEEKLHVMLLKTKQNEAREAGKKHQMQMMKKGAGEKQSGNAFGSSPDRSSASRIEKEVVINERPPSEDVKLPEATTNVRATTTSTKKGLQLMKPKRQEVATSSTTSKKESTTTQEQNQQQDKLLREEQQISSKPEYNPLQAPVLVDVEEKIKCEMSRDGALNIFEIIGDVFLTVRDPSKAASGVAIAHENHKAFKLALHPSLNKTLWNQKGLLVSKESDQSFPIGIKVPTIKYRFASTNTNDLPFQLTYWYTDEGSLTLEAEFNNEQERIRSLTGLSFTIPLPGYENPQVKLIANGDYEVDSSSNQLKWMVEELNEQNTSANIEVQLTKKTKVDDLFPIRVDFVLNEPFYRISSPGAVSIGDQSKIACECNTTLAADNWLIL